MLSWCDIFVLNFTDLITATGIDEIDDMDRHNRLNILFVADKPSETESALQELQQAGYHPESRLVSTEPAFCLAMQNLQPDLIISDYVLREFNGLEALKIALRLNAAIPFLFLTESINEETAVACMKAGASDYILKEHISQLPIAVQNALIQRRDSLSKELVREANEERTQAFIDSSTDLIFIKDDEFRYVVVNEAYGKLFAKPIAELIGKTDFELMQLQSAEVCHLSDLKALAQHATVISVEPFGEKIYETRKFPIKLRNEQWGIGAFIRDITETRQAEEALIRSEAELQAIFSSLPDVVMVLDADGHYIKIASSTPELLFQPQDDLIGETLHEVFPAETADLFLSNIRAAIQTKQIVHLEYELTIHGQHKWFLGTISPMAAGSVIFIARDNTIRKNAERELYESEERYKALFQFNHAVMLIIDPARLTIIDANQAACQYYGWPYAEIIRKNLDEIYLLPGSVAIAILQNDRSGRQNRRIFKHRLADGQVRDVEVFSGPIHLNGQTLLYSIVHDITERIEIHKALQASEQKFRELFNNANDAIFINVMDDQGKPGRFLEVNEIACQRLGYSRTELLTMTLDEITDEASKTGTNQKMAELRGKDEIRFETVRVARQGQRIPVEISARIFLLDDQKVMLSISRDVTERKRLEEQFYQAQKMESVGRLAGGIAHDFNNLLTVINGYSEILLSEVNPELPTYGHLKQIFNAGSRAARLTQQLLAFSRRQILKLEVIDLNEIVNDTKAMLRRLIGEDIELTTTLETQISPVKADRTQMEQVIINLAINAREAMLDGGKLSIETKNVDLDKEYVQLHRQMTPGRYAVLIVSDNGIGMDKALQDRIFEPFFTTKAEGKGTGLGLSTVYGIIKQSGGYIWVYSELNQGTTFKIYFPVVNEKLKQNENEEFNLDSYSGSETILVVEDEEMVREMTQNILKRFGYQVLEASNGEEAVSICTKLPAAIDLVLTDVVMPQMSGKVLADQLKTLKFSMKVIYMSGYTDDAIIKHKILDKDFHFVHKPFSPTTLLKKVREVLDGK